MTRDIRIALLLAAFFLIGAVTNGLSRAIWYGTPQERLARWEMLRSIDSGVGAACLIGIAAVARRRK